MSATLDPVVAGALRAGLAWLLWTAAWHKLRDPRAFREAVAGYGLAPQGLVPLLAAAFPAAELGLGAGLLAPATASAAALGAAALLSLYAFAIGAALAGGRRGIDCGCGGPTAGHVLRPALVVRNAVLVAVALAASLAVAPRELVWIDAVSGAGAVIVLACLHSAVELSLEQAAAGRRLRPRSDP